MIDIIIVTYNAKDKLRSCLESIEKHTRGIRYLITIVNNSSTDGTFEYLENYKKKNGIQIINNKRNLGFSGAANIALKRTSNRFIVLLDDDTEVTKGWLHKLYNKSIKNNSGLGIVGPKIVFPKRRIHCAEFRVRPLKLTGCDEIDRGQRDYIKECDALIGSCWLMRRDLIKKVGYFDEQFFPCQGEDIDYCLRARLTGYKIIYNGKVKVIHHHLFRDGGRFRKNNQKFLQKWRNILPKFPLEDSHPIDKYISKGVDYLEKKKFKQALTEFQKVELFDKRFSEPLFIGIALEGLGKYNEAIQQFKRALNLNPKSLLARSRLLLLYKKLGLIKKAKRQAIKTLALFSSYKNRYF